MSFRHDRGGEKVADWKEGNSMNGVDASQEKHLTKRDISHAAWYWSFFCQSSQNFERMQGGSYCATVSRPLEKLYGDDKEALADALTRNMMFFNTHPELGAMIPGIALALEERRANDKNFDPEMISNLKNALMGPFAGIGDSILAGVINPIFLSIGIGLSTGGSPIGAIVFMLLWCGLVIPMKYLLFVKGYNLGLDAVKTLTNERLKSKVISALTIVGLVVIGGVASTTVKAPIAWVYTSGEMVINLQETLNGIMPGIVPLLFALLCWLLVDKKGFTTNKLLLFILVFAAAMTAFGIM